MKKSAWISLLVLSFSLPVFAAVPRSLVPKDGLNEKQVQEALKLPLENRIQALKAHGPRVLEKLQTLSFDRNQSLEVRWRSLTALPYLDRATGRRNIERALNGEEWYLRNAAAVALPALDRDYALEASAKLLSDPALVVRTAAAQNMLRLNAREKEPLLWEKLNAKENFRNGESLWVRRHIARALAEFARAGTEAKFVALLSDKDARLHPFAIRALERLTGKKMSQDRANLKEHRSRWMAWARQSG
ncbi:MAG: HEAT repeat domain-containing protein [Bdellovibrionales bacterium]